jgi:hypothetical protein
MYDPANLASEFLRALTGLAKKRQSDHREK